jgi:hypothetical protein
MHAARKRAGCARASRGIGGVSRRRVRIRDPHALPRGLRAARGGNALQQHRRLQRECGGAALSASRAPAPASLRSFLIDAGAQFRGYAADITRTYAAAPGTFSDLIAALNTAQLRLCDEIVAGRDYRQVHLSAHRLVGDVLEQVGLTTLGPGGARGRCHRRVLSARHRPSPGAAGARRRRRDGRPEGRRTLAARGTSVSAAHADARAGRGRDGRARHLFHRLAARGRPQRRARRPYRLERGGAAAALRRHSHRGQRRDHRQCPGKS